MRPQAFKFQIFFEKLAIGLQRWNLNLEKDRMLIECLTMENLGFSDREEWLPALACVLFFLHTTITVRGSLEAKKLLWVVRTNEGWLWVPWILRYLSISLTSSHIVLAYIAFSINVGKFFLHYLQLSPCMSNEINEQNQKNLILQFGDNE